MDRRGFLLAGVGAAAGSRSLLEGRAPAARAPDSDGPQSVDEIRQLFPRLEHQVFLNAAGGTPLGEFAQQGLRKYEEYWRMGPGEGRGTYVSEMYEGTRTRLARLIGATPEEVALVQSTKAGEQIVLDGLEALQSGGNVVTNDLHFAGSLHNLIGMRRAGRDVRIVKSREFDVDLSRMADAIDDRTALVAVTLVSNVNGRMEPMRELADLAHARGAYVYADVIQAAGIVPFDVKSLGIDFAAGNGYKWLFGPHGTGYLYVRRDLQGTVLRDQLFPGHVRHNYPPWVAHPSPGVGDFSYQPRDTAQRYEPGHHAYLCYAALYEGLAFVERTGVAAMGDHATALTRRLRDRLDPQRYPCITPSGQNGPIITFTTRHEPATLQEALGPERIAVSGAPGQIRVSPAVYNTAEEVDLLADVLNGL